MTRIGKALATVAAAALLAVTGAATAAATTAATTVTPPGTWMSFIAYGSGPSQEAARDNGIYYVQIQVPSNGYDWATQCQVDSVNYTMLTPEPYLSWQAYVAAHCLN
ncbi:hypothetical protein [Amycolatopsis minnesotensis]|uniref:Secreted protein n=1 Tax=Amycolatopsis minnesotensis TaxID=337894 RepID=A0ABN2QHI6_9PSEU